MKVGKATEKEVDTLFNLLSALETISNGEMPEEENEEMDIGWSDLQIALDAGEDEHVSDKDNYFIRQALKHLLGIYSECDLMRAAANLLVFLDPSNNIVDHEKSTLELNPIIIKGLSDTARLDWLYENGISKVSKEIILGKSVDHSNFRERIDEKMAQEKKQAV